MGIWRREVWAFVVCLCAEWVTLLTGGIPAALLVVWGYAKAQPITAKWGYGFLMFTFLTAVFRSWRKQWREADKEFIQIGPAALLALREGKTTPYANTFLRPYIGKRIKITGTFYDVSGIFSVMKSVHIHSEGILISAHVPFWTAWKFMTIPKESVMTVIGTVSEINSMWLKISGIQIVPNPVVVATNSLDTVEIRA